MVPALGDLSVPQWQPALEHVETVDGKGQFPRCVYLTDDCSRTLAPSSTFFHSGRQRICHLFVQKAKVSGTMSIIPYYKSFYFQTPVPGILAHAGFCSGCNRLFSQWPAN